MEEPSPGPAIPVLGVLEKIKTWYPVEVPPPIMYMKRAIYNLSLEILPENIVLDYIDNWDLNPFRDDFWYMVWAVIRNHIGSVQGEGIYHKLTLFTQIMYQKRKEGLDEWELDTMPAEINAFLRHSDFKPIDQPPVSANARANDKENAFQIFCRTMFALFHYAFQYSKFVVVPSGVRIFCDCLWHHTQLITLTTYKVRDTADTDDTDPKLGDNKRWWFRNLFYAGEWSFEPTTNDTTVPCSEWLSNYYGKDGCKSLEPSPEPLPEPIETEPLLEPIYEGPRMLRYVVEFNAILQKAIRWEFYEGEENPRSVFIPIQELPIAMRPQQSDVRHIVPPPTTMVVEKSQPPPPPIRRMINEPIDMKQVGKSPRGAAIFVKTNMVRFPTKLYVLLKAKPIFLSEDLVKGIAKKIFQQDTRLDPTYYSTWVKWVQQVFDAQKTVKFKSSEVWVKSILFTAIGRVITKVNPNAIGFMGAMEAISGLTQGTFTLASKPITIFPNYLMGTIWEEENHFLAWFINLLTDEYVIIDPFAKAPSIHARTLMNLLLNKLDETFAHIDRTRNWIDRTNEAKEIQQQKGWIQKDTVSCGYICALMLIRFAMNLHSFQNYKLETIVLITNPLPGLEGGITKKGQLVKSETWLQIMHFLLDN